MRNYFTGLSMAAGDFVILADHDDTIPPQAFYEVAKAINKHPDCDVLYSDEDKLDMDGKALFDPHFKPDFNPDLLTSVNYICHLFVVKKELLDRVGGFRQNLTGRRIMILSSAAQNRQKRLSIFPRCCITGAAIRDQLPATRKARCMLLRREPEPLWLIMSVWELQQRKWKRV